MLTQYGFLFRDEVITRLKKGNNEVKMVLGYKVQKYEKIIIPHYSINRDCPINNRNRFVGFLQAQSLFLFSCRFAFYCGDCFFDLIDIHTAVFTL